MGNHPEQLSTSETSTNRPATLENPQVKELKPVFPNFELPENLPTLTPEQTRAFTPVTLQASASSATNNSETWGPDWDAAWNDGALDYLGYVTPEDKQYRIEIDPSNYGDRYVKDVKGNPVQNEILVVLHETTSSAESAVHTFLTHHPNDADQVSYHALILIDGRIVHLVPPEKRAYGAGNSEFISNQGIETVQTNSKYPASVNNFAYHISLETPIDAQDKAVETHSGYSLEQYESLAWLIRELQVPPDRVTTHRDIDRANDRSDPRSFDMGYLASLLY